MSTRRDRSPAPTMSGGIIDHEFGELDRTAGPGLDGRRPGRSWCGGHLCMYSGSSRQYRGRCRATAMRTPVCPWHHRSADPAIPGRVHHPPARSAHPTARVTPSVQTPLRIATMFEQITTSASALSKRDPIRDCGYMSTGVPNGGMDLHVLSGRVSQRMSPIRVARLHVAPTIIAHEVGVGDQNRSSSTKSLMVLASGPPASGRLRGAIGIFA